MTNYNKNVNRHLRGKWSKQVTGQFKTSQGRALQTRPSLQCAAGLKSATGFAFSAERSPNQKGHRNRVEQTWSAAADPAPREATPLWEERSDGVIRAATPCESAVAATALPTQSIWLAVVGRMVGVPRRGGAWKARVTACVTWKMRPFAAGGGCLSTTGARNGIAFGTASSSFWHENPAQFAGLAL